MVIAPYNVKLGPSRNRVTVPGNKVAIATPERMRAAKYRIIIEVTSESVVYAANDIPTHYSSSRCLRMTFACNKVIKEIPPKIMRIPSN